MLSTFESDLIRLSARQKLSGDAIERIRETLAGSLQWDALIETAWRHGVAPLLFHHLQEADRARAVPPKILDRLRQAYVRSAFRYRTHSATLADIFPRFRLRGVDLILLKGAALAPAIYRDGALRPYGDIDLLVRSRDVEAARKILGEASFLIAPGLLSEKFSRKYHVNLPFVRAAPPPVHIELHWRLTDRFSAAQFDHEDLFARAQSIPLLSGEGTGLSPEDELIYLATHLDNHGYLNRAILAGGDIVPLTLHELSGNRLIWFTDLHELIVSDGFDWSKVLEQASTSQASGPLGVSLRLVRHLLDTPIDQTILQALPLTKSSWPKRKVSEYAVTLARSATRGREQHFWRNKVLATRKGFELRLIRLVDIWQYLFPARANVTQRYRDHVCGAFVECGKMFFELLWLRVSRRLRVKRSA